jgi:hypothetical protein
MTCYRFDLATNRWSREPSTVASAAHTNLLTDTFYLVIGVNIIPAKVGSVATGRWRSKRFILQDYVGFGWLRVNASFSAGVVVRLYADGALFYTAPTILSRDPVRLPAGRSKRWELEIESVDRITSVVVATTTAELPP